MTTPKPSHRYVLTGFADEAAPDLAGQVRALVRNGLSHVEARQLDGQNVGDITPEKAREVARTFADAGIGTSCIGSPIGKIDLKDPLPPHLEKLRRVCETARTLGTRRIRVFSFYLPKGVAPATCREEVVDRLGRLLDVAAAADCVLLHENERFVYGETWERCLELYRTFGDRLRCILDPGNFVVCDVDPWAAAQALLPWVDYLHVKDAHMADHRIVPAGEGDARFPEILELVATKGGEHFLSLEPHLALGPELDAEAAFDLAVAALRRLL